MCNVLVIPISNKHDFDMRFVWNGPCCGRNLKFVGAKKCICRRIKCTQCFVDFNAADMQNVIGITWQGHVLSRVFFARRDAHAH
jgi:hypothetical protein